MEQVYQTKLGDSRRIALPADLCRELDLQSGESLLIAREGEGITITPLRGKAENMRKELRELLGGKVSLNEDLKRIRKAEALREADPR